MFRFVKAPLALLLITLLIINGCKDDSSTEPQNPPEEQYQMAPPSGVSLEIIYDQDSSIYNAKVSWQGSKDEDNANFNGYVVVTYETNNEGKRISAAFYDSVNVVKDVHSIIVSGLGSYKYYKTSIRSLSYDSVLSSEAASVPAMSKTAPPSRININLDQDTSFYAEVSWQPSMDESMEDFMGYAVVTYELRSTGTRLSLHDSVIVSKPEHKNKVRNLIAAKYYKTYIYSIMENGEYSPAAQSNTYGKAFIGWGAIYELPAPSANYTNAFCMLSYRGIQVSYVPENINSIDILFLKEGDNYVLYSPADVSAPLENSRRTYFVKLNPEDWTTSKIETEPNQTSINIAKGDMIFLRTQDSIYAKIKILDFLTTRSYALITFNYKLQMTGGLRAAKK